MEKKKSYAGIVSNDTDWEPYSVYEEARQNYVISFIYQYDMTKYALKWS